MSIETLIRKENKKKIIIVMLITTTTIMIDSLLNYMERIEIKWRINEEYSWIKKYKQWKMKKRDNFI